GLQIDRKWSALERCADLLKPLEPQLAAELGARAAAELKSAPRIAAVELALRDHNLKRASAELAHVWTDSLSYPDLQHAYELAEAQAITALSGQLARAKDA